MMRTEPPRTYWLCLGLALVATAALLTLLARWEPAVCAIAVHGQMYQSEEP